MDTEKTDTEKTAQADNGADQSNKPVIDRMTDLVAEAAGALAETAVKVVARKATKAVAKRVPAPVKKAAKTVAKAAKAPKKAVKKAVKKAKKAVKKKPAAKASRKKSKKKKSKRRLPERRAASEGAFLFLSSVSMPHRRIFSLDVRHGTGHSVSFLWNRSAPSRVLPA